MRDAINRDEFDRLVKEVKAGKEWGEVRGIIPGVDPEALDRAFKAMVFKAAGLEEARPEPVPEVEEAEEVEEPRSHHAKKGKKGKG